MLESIVSQKPLPSVAFLSSQVSLAEPRDFTTVCIKLGRDILKFHITKLIKCEGFGYDDSAQSLGWFKSKACFGVKPL